MIVVIACDSRASVAQRGKEQRDSVALDEDLKEKDLLVYLWRPVIPRTHPICRGLCTLKQNQGCGLEG